MAELEMVTGGLAAGPVRALGRWGILRLLPRWLGEQVAAGGRVETWSDVAPLPVPVRREQAPVAAPAQAIAQRAATGALRRTIDAWRAAEHELEALEIGSRDRAHLQAEVDALRATHHRLFLEVSLPSRIGAAEAMPR
ncbi:MAG TPA: hypothetical protein VMQ65_01050 [Candidatus Limnocylindria bacterium]|nr:hypothetical protein [Candidatus Limnocylindria bacterium]